MSDFRLVNQSSSSSFFSSIRMMMRLLLNVSIWLCLALSHRFVKSYIVTRNNLLLSHVISATRISLFVSFLRHQHSEPYNTIGTKKVSYDITLVVFEKFFALHRLLNLFTIADAIPILLSVFLALPIFCHDTVNAEWQEKASGCQSCLVCC